MSNSAVRQEEVDWPTVWPAVSAEVRKRSQTTFILLENAWANEPEGDLIRITTPTEELARRLNDPRNLNIIKRALRTVTGSDWYVRCDSEAPCDDESFGAFMRKVTIEANVRAASATDTGPPFGSSSESIAGQPGTGIGSVVTDKYHDFNELDPINILSHMQIKGAECDSAIHPHRVILEGYLSPKAFETLEKFLTHVQEGGNALWPMPDGTWV